MEQPSVGESFDALVGLVAAVKAASPFAPVTVLVPSHASALDVYRLLARRVNGGKGLVAVTCLTPGDLAQRVFDRAGLAAGRSPVTTIVREGAVLNELSKNAGIFDQVADQPATALALARASAELDDVTLTDDKLPKLVADVVRVHQNVTRALGPGWHTQHDVVAAAITQLPSHAAGFGTVISFLLPTECSDADRKLLEALAAAVPVTTIARTPAADSVPTDTRVLSITDADDEARTVSRLVVEQLKKQIPGHRIGVFWGAADPYRVLLHRHLADAGVEVNGPAARQYTDMAYVRGFLTLLGLDRADIDRRQVLDVLAEGVLRWSEEKLPSSARCERLYTTEAVEEPEPRPTVRFVETPEEPADPTTAGVLEYRRKQSAERATFDNYILALSLSLTTLANAQTWPEAALSLEAMFNEHFDPITFYDAELTECREAVTDAIRALGSLEGVAPRPTLRSVRAALASQLATLTRRHGTFGTGVTLGSLASGAARDLDVVIVVGLAEGLTPTRLRDDALLPDSVRVLWHGVLPLLAERAAKQHREFLDTLASAARVRIVTFPRGNLRGGGERGASRWLTTHIASSAARGSEPVEIIGSYHDGILSGVPIVDSAPVTAQTWRLRALMSGADGNGTPRDTVLELAQAMRADRASGVFSRFNGNLSSQAHLLRVLDRPLTATSLEDWIASPLSYFLHRVLDQRIFTDVQLDVEIDALTRGSMLHEILEDHVAAQISGTPDAGSLEALQAISEQAFESWRVDSWIDHLWQRDMNVMRRDLKTWWGLQAETASNGWLPQHAEAAFGLADPAAYDALLFTLDDGSTIRFSGKVDRIDYHPDGSIRVVDYKAGTSDRFSKLSSDSPTAGSSKLQLPVYGLFAQAQGQGNGQTGTVLAEYDFITQRGGHTTIGYPVTDHVVDQLRSDVSAIVAAIRLGVFPPRPASGSFQSITQMIGTAALNALWGRLSPHLDHDLVARFWPEEDDK
ncbi:PD-(D/E)XK nuclease family protein [Cryobacterium sp. Hh7]|uniref:PD-(D/E)XK nuclease family protein n=1 Tax=Cryobacterium sp. Hh7 TaxID=1259159 RepID=UPI00141BDB95|nr:PD-(D/E)XK nuclease family protein [Cryobacterium sp. Hh7]